MPYIGAGIQRFNTADGLTVSGSTELDGAVVVNESSADADFRVESNGNANMLFVDAGNDRIGIGTNTPAHDVEIVTTNAGSVNDSLQIRNNATSSGTGSRIRFINSTDNTSDANGAAISSVRNGDDNDLVFETENSTRVTIDHAGTTTLQCSAGDSNQALQAYHPTSTSSRTIAKFQSNVGSTQADKVTIGCDGKVTIADGDLVIGTSGHGIDFSATGDASGATSELLDDYEEGTWTPVLTTSSGTAATYGAQQIGKYVKIGDLVHIYFDIAINQVNNSNTTLVSGHPFNSVNNDALAVSFFSTLAVSPVFVQFQSVGSSGFMAVGLTSAGTNITNGMGIFGNSTRIIASGTYRTA